MLEKIEDVFKRQVNEEFNKNINNYPNEPNDWLLQLTANQLELEIEDLIEFLESENLIKLIKKEVP